MGWGFFFAVAHAQPPPSLALRLRLFFAVAFLAHHPTPATDPERSHTSLLFSMGEWGVQTDWDLVTMLFITLFIEAVIVELASEMYWLEVEQIYLQMEEDEIFRQLEAEAEDRWLMFNDYRPDYPF